MHTHAHTHTHTHARKHTHTTVNKQTSTTPSLDVNSLSAGHQTRQSMFNTSRRLSAVQGERRRHILHQFMKVSSPRQPRRALNQGPAKEIHRCRLSTGLWECFRALTSLSLYYHHRPPGFVELHTHTHTQTSGHSVVCMQCLCHQAWALRQGRHCLLYYAPVYNQFATWPRRRPY